MGLSLRLYCADGDVYVPTAVRPTLKNLYTEQQHPLATIQQACRFSEFSRYPSIEFPIEFLFLLRRLSIRLQLDPRCKPEPIANSKQDPVVEQFMDELIDFHHKPTYTASALCNHGHNDGMYVPADLPKTLWEGEFSIGSSQALLSELKTIGAVIGLPDDAALDAWFESPADDHQHPFFREQYACAALSEMARLSIRFSSAIVFS